MIHAPEFHDTHIKKREQFLRDRSSPIDTFKAARVLGMGIRRVEPDAVFPGIRRIDLQPSLMGKCPRARQLFYAEQQRQLPFEVASPISPASVSFATHVEVVMPEVIPRFSKLELLNPALE